jgi:hypothetical protein
MKPDDFSPFYHVTGPYNVRINEREMSQNVIAPAAWMQAIYDGRPRRVIEIGTCKGGLSSLLSGVLAMYGAEFHTMDVRAGGQENQYPLYGKSEFYQWDCFQHISEIRQLIQRPGKTFLLCDGGNKAKEFNTFAHFLKPGDVIAGHDYVDETIHGFTPTFWGCCELRMCDVIDTIKELKLFGYEQNWFKYSAWLVMQRP